MIFPHELFNVDAPQEADVCGVPDTACRKTLVGEYALRCIEGKLRQQGLAVVYSEGSHVFRFGNSETLSTQSVATIPAMLGHHKLLIRAAVLPGKGRHTPLLLSKELLRKLGAVMDMGNDVVTFPHLGVRCTMGNPQRALCHTAL